MPTGSRSTVVLIVVAQDKGLFKPNNSSNKKLNDREGRGVAMGFMAISASVDKAILGLV